MPHMKFMIIIISIIFIFIAVSIMDKNRTLGISPYCSALAPDTIDFLINQESPNVILSFENERGFPGTCHEYLLYDHSSQNLYFFGDALNDSSYKHLNESESLNFLDALDDTDIRNITRISGDIPLDASISTLVLLENGQSHEIIWSSQADNSFQPKIFEQASILVSKMKEICQCTEPMIK